jgi:hypothetical protein
MDAQLGNALAKRLKLQPFDARHYQAAHRLIQSSHQAKQ